MIEDWHDGIYAEDIRPNLSELRLERNGFRTLSYKFNRSALNENISCADYRKETTQLLVKHLNTEKQHRVYTTSEKGIYL
ncbi:hypothetical protein HYFRA_00013482 [Hymenoscyphus fraxineus]|uniref:Uncharacterized protein n=1 Tax=Hymenoscyphus fraxineus TaxID=746836 RepID=A0A9N9PZ65_9HELO|nr:hypothetical protein HYFRA_00013482 [Hymenoscyphus fraxineus]